MSTSNICGGPTLNAKNAQPFVVTCPIKNSTKPAMAEHAAGQDPGEGCWQGGDDAMGFTWGDQWMEVACLACCVPKCWTTLALVFMSFMPYSENDGRGPSPCSMANREPCGSQAKSTTFSALFGSSSTCQGTPQSALVATSNSKTPTVFPMRCRNLDSRTSIFRNLYSPSAASPSSGIVALMLGWD